MGGNDLYEIHDSSPSLVIVNMNFTLNHSIYSHFLSKSQSRRKNDISLCMLVQYFILLESPVSRHSSRNTYSVIIIRLE